MKMAAATAGLMCTVGAGPRPLAEIPEASGVTVSRRTPGIIWSHNDSGAPTLFALDRDGKIHGRVTIANARIVDWEDVTAAKCPAGDCLYIADIGDNGRGRPSVTIYRVPEPKPDDKQTRPAESFTVRYPDGAHDAEALFAAGDDLFIITKDDRGTLYRLAGLRSGTNMLARVRDLNLKRVTDADASPDGRWVVVRTDDEAIIYRTADLTRADSAASGTHVSLRELNEPQGEGAALDAAGMLYLTSEGGKAGAGRIAVLRCSLK